jgi:hypothetical protein
LFQLQQMTHIVFELVFVVRDRRPYSCDFPTTTTNERDHDHDSTLGMSQFALLKFS